MPTASELLSVFAPQFDAVATRAATLALAETRTSSSYFGDNRSEAVALRAAHILTCAQGAQAFDGSTVGPISSKSEGDLSVSFGSLGGADSYDDLATTSYGRQLKGLLRASGSPIRVTGIPFTVAFQPRGGF